MNVTIELTLSREALGRGAPAALDTLWELADFATTEVGGPTRGVRMFPDSRTVLRGGEKVILSRREFDLLLFLAEHPRQVFTRWQLLEQVWGYTQTGVRTVDVHIRRLRVKVGGKDPLFATVRGIGYRLDEHARVSVITAVPTARGAVTLPA